MSTKQTYDEQELVAQLRQRNDQAFSYLYDHYAPALYGIVRQIVTDTDLAADVLQEAFVNIWQKIDTYDAGKGRLFTWMLNICRNAAIDKTRSRAFRRANVQEPLTSAEGFQTGTKPGIDEYGLKRVLLRLKDEQRQLIELSYFQGFTHEQIARALDMPLGTVKTRIRAALTQLRALLS